MDDKELVLNRAKNAIISRDFALAARLYNGLLMQEPGNIQLLNGLGSVYIKAGNDSKAIPYFEKILTLSPNNFDALNSLGGAYRRIGQYDKAVVFLKKALQTGKNNAEANYNLGFTYKVMGKQQEAISCFEDVIVINSRDVLAYNHLGSIYADQKNYDKAVQTYKRGLQVDPNHPILQYNLAKCYEALKDDSSAVQAYETALKAKPGWQDAVSAYAKLLIEHRKTKVAADAVRNSISLHPQDAELHNLLGKILILQGNYEEAIASSERADSLKPNTSEFLNTLAQGYEKAECNQEAVNTITRAVKLDENNIEAKKSLVHIQLSAGQVEDAFENLNKITEEWNSSPELLNLAGQYYILKNDDNQAEDLQKKSLSLDSSYTDSYNEYALRYKQVKKFDKAKAQVKNAIDENMKDVNAWILQGQINEEMGNFEDAEEDYSTAMAFDPHNVLAKKLYKVVNKRNSDVRAQKAEMEQALENQEEAVTENEESVVQGEEIDLSEFGMEDEKVAETEAVVEDDDENVSLDDLHLEEDQDVIAMDEENALFSDMQGDLLEEPDEVSEDGQLLGEEIKQEKDELPEEEAFEPMNDSASEAGGPSAEENLWKDANPVAEEKASDEVTMPSEDAAPSVGESGSELAAPAEEESATVENAFEPAADEQPVEAEGVSEMETPFESASVEENAEEGSENIFDIADEISNEPEDAMDFGNPNFAFDDLYENEDVPQEKPSISEEDASMIAESVQDAQNSAQKANEAAEKAWMAAQNAADAAQATDQAENYIRDVAESAVEEAANKVVLKHFEKILPEFAKMIDTQEGVKKFAEEIALFKKLREIGESLPEPQNLDFLESKTRVILDYLIARLSGKKGLLKTILAMQELTNTPESELEPIEDFEQAIREVFAKLKELAQGLEDNNLCAALIKLCDEVLERI